MSLNTFEQLRIRILTAVMATLKDGNELLAQSQDLMSLTKVTYRIINFYLHLNFRKEFCFVANYKPVQVQLEIYLLYYFEGEGFTFA